MILHSLSCIFRDIFITLSDIIHNIVLKNVPCNGIILLVSRMRSLKARFLTRRLSLSNVKYQLFSKN